MWTHTRQKSTARLLLSTNHQVYILLHHLHKTHVEFPSYPNASLLNMKLPNLHLTQNQSHPIAHPPENLTNFHHLQSVVDPQLYHSHHCPLHDLPNVLLVGVLHQGPIQSVSRFIGLPHPTISLMYVCNFGRLSVSHVRNHQTQHHNVALCVLP